MQKKYGKLVRDNIPAIIQADGQTPITRILNDTEYLTELTTKLKEETAEFEADHSAEELADVMEVVQALRDAIKLSAVELEAIRAKKSKSNGAFHHRIYLEGVL